MVSRAARVLTYCAGHSGRFLLECAEDSQKCVQHATKHAMVCAGPADRIQDSAGFPGPDQRRAEKLTSGFMLDVITSTALHNTLLVCF